MTAILETILTAVKSEIESLNLTDIADAKIRIQKRASTHKFESSDYPAILIAPLTPKHNPALGTNLRDQVEYQILVLIVDNDNVDQTANRGKYLTWYEEILKKFRTPGLSGASTVVNSYVTPGAVVDPSWVTGEYISGITLWFISWEART